MRIDLDEVHTIYWDGTCFQLLERKAVTGEGRGAKLVKQENIGQIREHCLGYYGSLPQVLMGYLKLDIAKDSRETMEALMDYFDVFFERMDAVFKPIGYDIRERYQAAKAAEAARNKKPEPEPEKAPEETACST